MPATAVSQEKPLLAGISDLHLPASVGLVEVRLALTAPLTDEELLPLSCDHGDLQIEQSAAGELVIMPPAFADTGNQEAELAADFVIWSRATGGGKIFGPSAGFKLPNGTTLAPDVSWLSRESLDALSSGGLHRFVPCCPDFVLEVRSGSDRLPVRQRKMVEYLANGARLGWLVDPIEKQVFVYRPGEPVEHFWHPATLSGEPVLAGFSLDLSRVW